MTLRSVRRALAGASVVMITLGLLGTFAADYFYAAALDLAGYVWFAGVMLAVILYPLGILERPATPGGRSACEVVKSGTKG